MHELALSLRVFVCVVGLGKYDAATRRGTAASREYPALSIVETFTLRWLRRAVFAIYRVEAFLYVADSKSG